MIIQKSNESIAASCYAVSVMSSETAAACSVCNAPSFGLLFVRVLWVMGVTGVGVALPLACPERYKEQISQYSHFSFPVAGE